MASITSSSFVRKSFILTGSMLLMLSITTTAKSDAPSFQEHNTDSENSNKGKVAGTMDKVRDSNPSGDADKFIEMAAALNDQGQNNVFRQLSPEANGAASNVARNTGSAFQSQQQSRTNDLRLAMTGEVPEGPAGPSSTATLGLDVWAKGFGSWYDQDERGGHDGFETDTYGFIAGVDYTVGNFVYGASFGYSDTDVDYDLEGTESEIAAYTIGLYTTYKMDSLYFDGGLSYIRNDIRMRRELTGIDTLTSRHSADIYSAYAGVGYKFDCTDKLSFTPALNLTYSYFDEGSYNENGLGGLEFSDYDDDSFKSTLGAKVSYIITERLRANFRAAWEHDFLGSDSVTSASLYGVKFKTDGMESDDDTYIFGVGLDADLTDSVNAFIDYDYQCSTDADGHNVQAGIRIEF